MFGAMVQLEANGKHEQVYQKAQAFLVQHFTRLPKTDLYYDAQGAIHSEDQRHQIVTSGLIVVQIHATNHEDAIGLLLTNDRVELDAVSTGARSELKALYGYHE